MEKYVKLKYINALIEKLMKEPAYQHEYENFYCGVGAVADRLLGLSTIQFEEPKEGRWLFSDYGGIRYYQCSCCDYEQEIPLTYTKDDVKKYKKYCTNCGAKMSEEA